MKLLHVRMWIVSLIGISLITAGCMHSKLSTAPFYEKMSGSTVFIAHVRNAGGEGDSVSGSTQGDLSAAEEKEALDFGTGFVIRMREQRFILTVNHLINGGEISLIFSDKRVQHPARLIGRDALLDVGLLALDNPDLLIGREVVLGDSDTVQVHDRVYMVGNPLGMKSLLAEGRVMGHDTNLAASLGLPTPLLVLDIRCAVGNSGSPIFNERGEVIGITLMVSNSVPICFVIPINPVKKPLELLSAGGNVRHAYLGVSSANSWDVFGDALRKQLRIHNKEPGVVIVDVHPGSPAEQAGMRRGDIMLRIGRINNRGVSQFYPVRDVLALQELVKATFSIGDAITIELLRELTIIRVKVVLEDGALARSFSLVLEPK